MPMQLSISNAALVEPSAEPVPETPPDLRELAGSAASLGSFGLRWQMIEAAPKRVASH